MKGFSWFFIGIGVDLVGEMVAYGVRVWKRKRLVRYFCIWYSYKTTKDEKILFDKICFECKQFPTEDGIISVIELRPNGNGFGSVKSLRISNIFEFKSKQDYLNFKG